MLCWYPSCLHWKIYASQFPYNVTPLLSSIATRNFWGILRPLSTSPDPHFLLTVKTSRIKTDSETLVNGQLKPPRHMAETSRWGVDQTADQAERKVLSSANSWDTFLFSLLVLLSRLRFGSVSLKTHLAYSTTIPSHHCGTGNLFTQLKFALSFY